MSQKSLFRRIKHENSGATAVEFAIVAVPFFMLLLGIIEYGMYMMTKVALESIVAQAGREASVTTGTAACDRVCTVRHYIEEKGSGLINYTSIQITSSNLSTGTGASTPAEFCMIPGPPHPCDGSPCTAIMNDVNGNGICDTGSGSFSVGGPGDLIELRVTYPWSVLNPFMKPFFGPAGAVVISSTTVVKNES